MKKLILFSGIIFICSVYNLKSQTIDFENPAVYKLASNGLNSPAVTITNPVKTAANNSDSVVVYDKPEYTSTIWSSAMQVILLPGLQRKYNNLLSFKAYLNHPTSCFVRTGATRFYSAPNYTDGWAIDSIIPGPYLLTDTNKWITLYYILDTFTVSKIDTLVIEFHTISTPDKEVKAYVDDITLSKVAWPSNNNYEPPVKSNIYKWDGVINLDGDLSESVWKDTLAIVNKQRYLSMGNVTDDADNSAIVHTSWNDSALLVGIYVSDNEVDVKPDEGGYPDDGWLYDRIEIFVDPYARNKDGNLKAYQWQMRFNPREFIDTFLTMMIYTDTTFYFDNPVQKYIHSNLINYGDSYVLEAIIPFWTFWCGSGVSIASARDSAAKYIKAGYKLGYDISINDVDELNGKPHSSWSVINWANSTGNLNYNTSKYYGQLILADKPLVFGIKDQPVSRNACIGSDATFSIVANMVKTYQWFKSGNNGASWDTLTNDTTYEGAKTANLTVKNVSATLDQYQFRCMISDSTNFLTSNNVTLFVDPLTAVVKNPRDTTACSGTPVTFSIKATGSVLTYKWQVNSEVSFSNIINNSTYSGASTEQLSVNTSSVMGGYEYRCIVSGNCLPADTSGTSVLNVEPIPDIVKQPADTIIDINNSASFTVVTEGNNLTYQWQFDNGSGFTDLNNGSVYSGCNTETLQISSVTHTNFSYKYRCIISGNCLTSSLVSNEVSVRINTIICCTLHIPDFIIYPNPGKTEVSLTYTLSENSKVKIELFNILGKKIVTLVNGNEPVGSHSLHIDINKLMLSDGLYYVRITINQKQVVEKLTVKR